jgi:membrane protein
MAELWSLRGLSWQQLLKRTVLRSWEDEVFGQAARLAFYYFLGLFPALLFLLLILNMFPGTGSELRRILLDSVQQIVPRQAALLLAKTTEELNARAILTGASPWAAVAGAWALLNGTWAMMVGLNKAYGLKEQRRWWSILSIAFGLSISLGVMGLMALAIMLYGSRIEIATAQKLGLYIRSGLLWRLLQWPAIVVVILLSLASLYRFGPNLRDRRWQWSTPGAFIATALWVCSTVLLRAYYDHFGGSQKIYGAALKPVVTILLWLYLTGAAILIGGEANSEIEKAAAESGAPDVRSPGERRDGGAS